MWTKRELDASFWAIQHQTLGTLLAISPQRAASGQRKEQQITALSAAKLAELIRRKELTSEEVVKAFVMRIEKVNPQLNAIVQPESFERAIEQPSKLTMRFMAERTIPMT